jgi:hypothetical protein
MTNAERISLNLLAWREGLVTGLEETIVMQELINLGVWTCCGSDVATRAEALILAGACTPEPRVKPARALPSRRAA